MAETSFAETEALLAVMSEDDDEALRILDDMLPGERRALVGHLSHLSYLADDRLRCPRCGQPAEPLGSVSVGHLGGPRRQWHRSCLDAQRAEES